MSNHLDVNKISDKQERKAEHLADKYEKQGMGHDQAKNQALSDVAGEPNGIGGDKPKHANHQGGHRTGTQSDAHK